MVQYYEHGMQLPPQLEPNVDESEDEIDSLTYNVQNFSMTEASGTTPSTIPAIVQSLDSLTLQPTNALEHTSDLFSIERRTLMPIEIIQLEIDG